MNIETQLGDVLYSFDKETREFLNNVNGTILNCMAENTPIGDVAPEILTTLAARYEKRGLLKRCIEDMNKLQK